MCVSLLLVGCIVFPSSIDAGPVCATTRAYTHMQPLSSLVFPPLQSPYTHTHWGQSLRHCTNTSLSLSFTHTCNLTTRVQGCETCSRAALSLSLPPLPLSPSLSVTSENSSVAPLSVFLFLSLSKTCVSPALSTCLCSRADCLM